MRLVLLYSSPRFCIRVIVGIEISVGEENKQGEGNKRKKDKRRIMLQSISPDIILEERVIFPKSLDQFSPVCRLERLQSICIL